MTAQELYSSVTNQIVAALEGGSLPPWRKPWTGGNSGFLPLRHAGQPYRGINTLILFIQSDAMGYGSPYWLTFKQALEYKGSVRKGEKSTAILWCEPRSKKTTADDGTEGEDRFWISKVYRVFNAEQCDGLPDKYTDKAVHTLDPAQRIEHADTFIRNTGATIRHRSGGAYYRPSEDFINLPPFEAFTTPEGYAATALHELGHWTGHKSRLDRDLKPGTDRQAYSREEIISELTSCMVSAQLGIAPPDMSEHAAYIQFWIEAMKADPRYLFSAASKAQAAADYLTNLQPKPE
jgi:antirestriction protein ArdC